MTPFASLQLPAEPTVVAPDGSDVRVLLALDGASMAHFQLAAGQTSAAMTHRTVEEIWYVVAGRGQMWRRQGGREEVVDLRAGTCITIPQETHFQFQASADAPLEAVGVTLPPWPGAGEAMAVAGPWRAGREAPGEQA